MEFVVPAWLSVGMGVFSLIAAVVLLVQVAALKRVASGAAFADHMSYVTGGILCLAAAVLVTWLPQVVDVAALDEMRVFGDALVGVAMVLLGIYFFRVRRAMSRYLTYLQGDAALAKAHAEKPDEPEAPGA